MATVPEVLGRIAAAPPGPAPAERCQMCAIEIDDTHRHVVDLDSRHLMCVCRPCYLLFTDQDAALRFRAVPDRYLTFPAFTLAPGRWEELEIPVGLAFFFHNSTLDRTVAFYPGPAGAAESELPLGTWDTVLADNPGLTRPIPDVEALLVRIPDRGAPSCHLVPIDACYELVGRLRRVWRGFDGGHDARAELDGFFGTLARRSRPVEAGTSP
ncbi:DUF5947 family protein [Rhodococcus phenolicus]|uniref:DUF5947 family protein n=1 Tax=Rhodococcus phenolicus TaxID=263849 RepID=UPI00082BF088|nr:DUF5947 family protein [Rhodococcus phenolicus]